MKIKLTLIFFVLVSCGFSPLYSNNNDPVPKIKMLDNDTEELQDFKIYLKEFVPITDSDESVYSLKIDIKKTKEQAFIDKDALTRRYNIVLEAKYEIKSLKQDNITKNGTITISNGYNASNSEFSTYVSEQDSYKNGLKSLAQDIRTILMLL